MPVAPSGSQATVTPLNQCCPHPTHFRPPAVDIVPVVGHAASAARTKTHINLPVPHSCPWVRAVNSTLSAPASPRGLKFPKLGHHLPQSQCVDGGPQGPSGLCPLPPLLDSPGCCLRPPRPRAGVFPVLLRPVWALRSLSQLRTHYFALITPGQPTLGFQVDDLPFPGRPQWGHRLAGSWEGWDSPGSAPTPPRCLLV